MSRLRVGRIVPLPGTTARPRGSFPPARVHPPVQHRHSHLQDLPQQPGAHDADTPLIAARNLGKTYRDYPSPWARLLEKVTGTPRHTPIHALGGVDFELRAGESLAVLGENGAGKSTLLKILSGVTVPSEGSMEVRGRVASLLELGMGFHPELTGRQNIRLNAAMMGLEDQAIVAKTPSIIEFSELGAFIDRPVKTYSTGMAMRLGFAVAAQLEPDVLIVDEALSVGDGYFQKKCMDRIRELLDGGTTLLFCSHAMYYVTTFCRRALWLRDGRPVVMGPVEEVVREYELFLLEKGDAGGDAPAADRDGEMATLLAVEVSGLGDEPEQMSEDDGGASRCRVRPGDPLTVEISWRSSQKTNSAPGTRFHLGISFDRIDGVEVMSLATHLDGREPIAGEGRARLTIPSLPMLKGQYDLVVYLLDEHGLHVYDRRYLQAAVTVVSGEHALGLVTCEHDWTVDAEARQQRPVAVAVD